MKNFLKFFLVFLWTTILLGTGYYFVYNNISTLIAADHSGFQCRLIPDGIHLQSAHSVERVKFSFHVPFAIRIKRDQWIVSLAQNQIVIAFAPGFKVSVIKTNSSRSSKVNGEY